MYHERQVGARNLFSQGHTTRTPSPTARAHGRPKTLPLSRGRRMCSKEFHGQHTKERLRAYTQREPSRALQSQQRRLACSAAHSAAVL